MKNTASLSEASGSTGFNVLLTEDEKQKILQDFNDTTWDVSPAETLIALFEKQAQKTPGNVAVKFREQELTYEELDRKSNQVAHYLIQKGVKPGTLVPIWLDRSVEWVVAVAGVLKAAATYIPIDPAYPSKRVEYIISDANAKILISNSELNHLIKSSLNTELFLFDGLDAVGELPVSRPDVYADIEDLAYVIYTSGSTGIPKGVMVKHQSIQNLVTWHNQKFEVKSTSQLTLVAGLAFDISVWETWSALTSGGVLHVAAHEDRTDAIALVSFYQTNNITHAFAPTVLVPALVEHTRKIGGQNLKYLFTAGEQLKPVLTDDLAYTLVDYYGPTECTVYATVRIVKEENGVFVSSIGNPVANTQAYILGSQLEVLPVGAVGDLYISGTALAKGYLNNEELTASKFIEHPFKAGEKLYATGDLARWLPNGEVQFLGRKDNQVKIRGFRVELGEVEHALTNIKGIADAVVITKDNNTGNNKYLVAFIVPEQWAAIVDVADVRSQLKLELPGYMLPAQIITINEIPVTENGKTDKKQLGKLSDRYVSEAQVSEPPVNEAEQIIADIWAEVLERPVINRTDNFFDVGGDSLMVAIVTVDIREKLNVKVYIRDIYQNPVLKDLAAVLFARATEKVALPEEDMEPYVELERDVYLAPGTVFAGGFNPESLQNPSAVFLTGATGFVGIHLLQELLDTANADVYCLIRAQDEFHALEKIDECYQEFRVGANVSQRHRIKPVTGDLTKPYLGLTEKQFNIFSTTIDIIYHSASSVNFIEPYSYMKAPNVDGLREIIRLAGAGRTKCLALLSTISVYSWGHVFTGKEVMLESDDIAQNLLAVSKDIGYVRSKWVMEAIADLALKQGLPLITYRLGYAMCHSQTGASAPYQWWSGLVKNCIEFESYPMLTELREGLITVDYMTKSIAHITKNKEAIGHKFNLIASPETNLTLEDFFGLLKQYYAFELKGLSYKDWRKQWENDNKNRLYPLTSLFKDNMHEGLSTVELYQNTYVWDCQNLTLFLQGSGIEEPVFDKELLDNYFNYLEIPVQEQALNL